ncbi:Uncharacterised protein [Vibrio cholerae]|nr:Uncharacterised protein [Vibrio cholerae]
MCGFGCSKWRRTWAAACVCSKGVSVAQRDVILTN